MHNNIVYVRIHSLFKLVFIFSKLYSLILSAIFLAFQGMYASITNNLHMFFIMHNYIYLAIAMKVAVFRLMGLLKVVQQIVHLFSVLLLI